MTKFSIPAFDSWTDDDLRDGVASGHVPEFTALEVLESRNPSPIRIPTPKDVFS